MTSVPVILSAATPENPSAINSVLIIGVIVQFFWSSIVTIVIYKLSKNDRDIDTMQKKLHDANERLIDERLRAISHKMREETNAAILQMKLTAEQASELEQRLNKIVEALPTQEIKSLREFHDMRDELKDCMVSKEQFHELQSDHKQLRERLSQMATVADIRLLCGR